MLLLCILLLADALNKYFNPMAALYGIIGYPLLHSFSPAYFRKKFEDLDIDALYDTFPLASITEFPDLLEKHPNIGGLSVTIPHKQAVIPYLDELDNTAQVVGAVNCISFKSGIKTGYNTDVIGFEKSLAPLLQPQHTQALILGTGGAAKAVAFVLNKLGISYQSVSRNPGEGKTTYDAVTPAIISSHKLIINASPAGMLPHEDTFPPLPYEAVASDHLLYDLVYKPEETKFLSFGKERGAVVKNGLEMLYLQADAAWQIWNA
jgi:shikimate dehydrogenase